MIGELNKNNIDLQTIEVLDKNSAIIVGKDIFDDKVIETELKKKHKNKHEKSDKHKKDSHYQDKKKHKHINETLHGKRK